MEVSFNRHNKFVGPADLAEPVCIIGVGATGSHLALTAARMGFTNFVIWDHDIVEPHNLPNQCYDLSHVGMAKVDALEEVLLRFNPRINVKKHKRFFTSEAHSDQVEGILVVTVDTMSARKDITASFEDNPLVSMVVESRLGFEFGEVNILDPMNNRDLEKWRRSLRNDDEIPESVCGLRICVTTVGVIANYMVQQMCMHKANERDGVEWSPVSRMVMAFDKGGMKLLNI